MCYRDFLYTKIKLLQDKSMEIILRNGELDDPELVKIVRSLDNLIIEWIKCKY